MADKDWKITTLGEQVELLTGFPFKSSKYTNDGNSIPLLRGDNIIQGRFRWDNVKRWPQSETEAIASYFLKEGDVVLAMDRPWIEAGLKYACVSIYDLPCLLVQRVARLRAKKTLNQRFLRYIIASAGFTNHILGVQTGTAVPHISSDQIKEYRFLLPSLSEQHCIANILGTLDDKIELNRQMNKTLEPMTRAIFQSWFVDFDPVRAKLEDRTPLGMNAETAAMFPSSFENSAIGKIPTGWKVASIGEIIEFAYGKALKEEARYSGSIPVYGSNGQVGWHNEALVKGPGIVVGRKGNPGIVTWVAKDFFPIDTTFYVVPKGPIHAMHYIYYVLSLQNLASLAADSAVPGLNRNIAYMTEILVPSVEIADIFDKTVEPFFNRVSMNNEESRTLAAIRDALLPKLLSGEIRVKDAEKYAKALL